VTDEVDAHLFELKPYDIHLELPIAESTPTLGGES
jgi:hypothetical protein